MKICKLFICASLIFISCKRNVKSEYNTMSSFEVLDNINLSSGKIIRLDSFPSKYISSRTVDIWLPDNYSDATDFSVLYMNDGQNLFDAEKTWNKQEWKVDEIVSELIQNKQIPNLIVVAIWNIPESRHQDYFPEKAYEMLVQKDKDSLSEIAKQSGYNMVFNADEYLKFVVEELKPYVDTNFSTRTGVKHTFIAGASMGGLISMYAVCEYPDVFGGAACLSTHWPGVMPAKYNSIPASFFEYMHLHIPRPKNHKFYFDYGTEGLDAYYPQYLKDIDRIFQIKGYTENNYMNLEFEGADHSENSWNRRFDIPLTFLFNN